MPEACIAFESNPATILAWEKEKGSKILESTVEMIVVAPDKNKEPSIVERVYIFEDGSLATVLILLNHIDKAYYFTGDIYDSEAYCLTKEFLALINTAGYELLQSKPPIHYFHSAKDELVQIVYIDRYAAEGLLPRLTIQIVHQSAIGM